MNSVGLGTILYYLGFAVFFFVMMRYGCGSHIMGHGSHGHGSHGHGSHGDDAHDSHGSHYGDGDAPGRAIDPVCGMSIATASAKTSFFGGRAYFFCSQSCRDKFENDPNQYVNQAKSV